MDKVKNEMGFAVATPLTTIKKNNEEIVRTMLKQVQMPNRIVFGSWGATRFVMAESDNDNHEPCLRFKVNGNHFKGYVHIFYNWADYYRIEFVSTHNNLKKVIDVVYFDELQEKIDVFVEKIKEYAF